MPQSENSSALFFLFLAPALDWGFSFGCAWQDDIAVWKVGFWGTEFPLIMLNSFRKRTKLGTGFLWKVLIRRGWVEAVFFSFDL